MNPSTSSTPPESSSNAASQSSVRSLANRGDALRADPRVAAAKQLLREAIAEHSATLTDVRGPDPALVAPFDAMLAEYTKLRGAPPFWPYLSAGLGNGP